MPPHPPFFDSEAYLEHGYALPLAHPPRSLDRREAQVVRDGGVGTGLKRGWEGWKSTHKAKDGHQLYYEGSDLGVRSALM